MRYTTGEPKEFTIRYGEHTADWTKEVDPTDTEASMVAWSGPSPVSDKITLRVYKTQWTNPDPEKTIASIDFISANSDPAPFLIAITAETL